MNWTDERVALLTKLWAEGLSASQIAAQLGGVSRNAVIGKVHRLKLSGRGKTTKAQPRAPKITNQASISSSEEKVTSLNSSPSQNAAPLRAARANIDKSTIRTNKTVNEASARKTVPLSTLSSTQAASSGRVSGSQASTKTSSQAFSQAPSQGKYQTRPQPSFTASSIKVDFASNEAANFDEQHASDSNVVPMKRNLTLLQLTEITCKWPIGDPLNEDFHFCGADAGEASPYCSYHSKIAFQTISDRRRIRA